MQHEHQLADTAPNAQYRRTVDAMEASDRTRATELKKGMTRPDGRPSAQAGLLAAVRAWLAYRDAHCVTVGFANRGGAYQDEAEGKFINDMTRKRIVELKQLSGSLTP